jgi:hypothetical protein
MADAAGCSVRCAQEYGFHALSTRFVRAWLLCWWREETTMVDERGYLAYMVRLWNVHHNGDLVWRASAENAHTGERHAFADLAALCEFLKTAVQEAAATSAQRERSPEERQEVG